ncbi:MAG: PHP domain-containing protein [Clostridia bacterium]|nr:PHP domain-containing protein [Clostridia bacterium]
MNKNLKYYRITPSVVKADTESEIEIRSFDGIMRFFDDTEYEVSFIPREVQEVPRGSEIKLRSYDKSIVPIKVYPENGVIKVKYRFTDEQAWRVHISTNEYLKHQNPLYEKYRPHWDGYIKEPQNGIDLFIYSVYEDLYGKIARKGDLHMHTNVSDGRESPELVCAESRRGGKDFIAITEHNLFTSPDRARELSDISRGLEVIPGEEVHNGYIGDFHMVNIGGTKSVNEVFLDNPERVEREAMALADKVQIPEGVDKREYLMRVWLYNEAKNSGGFVIFPHPFWNLGRYHVPTKMTRAILKNGLCDAFEVVGGVRPFEENLQVALWNDLRAEGVNIPVVGSTDSHSALDYRHFEKYTVIFGKDAIKSISDGYSVAVEAFQNENIRVYGSYRLSAYTHFLLENYFPIHDEMCAAAGEFAMQYVNGCEDARELSEKAEAKIEKFARDFFGI